MTDRPRLADHALLRRHVVDGVERHFIHHGRTGALVAIDERGCGLILLADGTRDLEGIALAATRAGHAHGDVTAIASFFSALAASDLLAGDEGPGAVGAWGEGLAARPVRVLPGYSFRCDGSGTCCSQYGSLSFSADDVRRARRAGLRTLDGDADAERVFLPLFGALPGGRMAMTLVDGSCLQLDADRRCGLHVAGGAPAKPVGCRIFPATVADDGESLRVSVALECECTIRSLVAGEGDVSGLLDAAVRHGADLPAGAAVRGVPDPVVLSGTSTAPRSELVRWVDEVLEHGTLDRALPACVALARALDAGSLATRGSRAIADASPSSAEIATELRPELERIAATMRSAAEAADLWRSARDRTRILRHAALRAAAALLARGIEATLDAPLPAASASMPPWDQVEALAVRAALFGHQLLEGRPLAEGLRELAAKLLLARELALAGHFELGHPVACVMATLRGAG